MRRGEPAKDPGDVVDDDALLESWGARQGWDCEYVTVMSLVPMSLMERFERSDEV